MTSARTSVDGVDHWSAARVGSGWRHLDKRRRRRVDAKRRAAQRTPVSRHSAPRHAASRHSSSGHPRPDLVTRCAGHAEMTPPVAGRGSSDSATRRMAAVLVVFTLCYGVAVGVLLPPRPGTDRDTGHEAVGAESVEPDASLTRPGAAAVPAGLPGGPSPLPGGPSPLPAEVAPMPTGLSIPAIGVDEPTLVPLGRNPDGSMEVPADFARAGWFTGGPTPGTPGPAVIAGHVDSRAGPAVFFRLRQLKAGDAVTVRLSNGEQARFVVDGVALYPKDDFPTEAVFGAVPGTALRLITCGGSFDHIARSYRSNVVVYASRHDLSS